MSGPERSQGTGAFRLRRCTPDEIAVAERRAVDEVTLREAGRIVDDVRLRGESALRAWALRLGDLSEGEPLVYDRTALKTAAQKLDPEDRACLERTAERIAAFAQAQLEALRPVVVQVPGGTAGQVAVPVTRAGCYAPGGRFPLPSSVLMTVVTARTAGVGEIWVASPRPTPVTLAAAGIAGADALLAVGGAQAVAALAFGAGPVPACDVVVGPGNRWVTAAKQLVAGRVGIDMLAGPSELVVVADGSADPARVAADLLAQAEHDPEALPVLVVLEEGLIGAVEEELERQLADLPTAAIAAAALIRGFAVVVTGTGEAARVCDRLAPEHLQLAVTDPDPLVVRLNHYGALFLGSGSAVVLGDYGFGPNHVLPTGGTARCRGGLSVFDFLRIRTWLRTETERLPDQAVADIVRLARLEGLEAHARAAERRRTPAQSAIRTARRPPPGV